MILVQNATTETGTAIATPKEDEEAVPLPVMANVPSTANQVQAADVKSAKEEVGDTTGDLTRTRPKRRKVQSLRVKRLPLLKKMVRMARMAQRRW